MYDPSLSLLFTSSGIGNPTGIVVPGQAIAYNPLNLVKDDGIAEGMCPYAGDTVTYSLCYDNTANTYEVENVSLVDTLPVGVQFVEAWLYPGMSSMPPDLINGNELTWEIGTLVAGAPQECIRVDAMIDESAAPEALFTNNATIGSDDTGPAFANVETQVCANQPPVALCADVVLEAGAGCVASGSVDAGSYDPDGDPTTMTEDPPSPYPLGDTLVTLTIEDSFGTSDSCTGTVSVVDTTPPETFCNAPPTITPPDAPIAFTATASDHCGATVEITGYDCWFINGAGRLTSKLESCIVSFGGDTVTIEDSGGVGDHIEWFLTATDASGNTTDVTCSVEVTQP